MTACPLRARPATTRTARAAVSPDAPMPPETPRWKAAQRAELAEARARSDALTLSERADEAVALYLLTVVELARRARDADELVAVLSRQEPLTPLRARWDALRGR